MSKSSLFSPKTRLPCPQCGGQLVVRRGKYGAFFGCSQYPQCDYQRPLKMQTQGHIVKLLDGESCPQCQSVLALRQGRFGMFICCSQYPECQHRQSLNKTDETVMLCPQCATGHLLERHSRFGKIFYGCSGYPACQFTLKAKPVVGICEFCQYPLLVEKPTAGGVKRCCASRQCGKPASDAN